MTNILPNVIRHRHPLIAKCFQFAVMRLHPDSATEINFA